MSNAAQSAVATVPLDIDVEVLERRLLVLRADIDAILTQLARRKAVPAAAEPADTGEPEAAAIAASAPEAEAAEPTPSPEANAAASDDASALAPAADTLVAPGTPEANAPLTAETPAGDDSTPSASQLADAAAAPAADTTACEAVAETQSVGDAAVLPAASAASAEPTPAAAPATDGPLEAPVEDEQRPSAPARPAEARVLSFEPRHRKQKALCAASPTAPARPRRRLVTKIAACIVALLAAATVLVVADRTMVVSAQSLPWVSPLPSYVPYGAVWPFFGQRQRASESSTADDRAASPSPSAADDLLLRYRAAWPTGA